MTYSIAVCDQMGGKQVRHLRAVPNACVEVARRRKKWGKLLHFPETIQTVGKPGKGQRRVLGCLGGVNC